uniref:Uncharacterized protein n=1 Tax=Anopheles dirus TaxID=7168 RepID=A0A182NXL2_9DIPT
MLTAVKKATARLPRHHDLSFPQTLRFRSKEDTFR